VGVGGGRGAVRWTCYFAVEVGVRYVSKNFGGAQPVRANGISGELEENSVQGEGCGGWELVRVSSGAAGSVIEDLLR
jgi:hypothetical protein